jgi:soluble lytic murein transglycosylase
MAVERDPARALAKDDFAVKTRGGRELLLYALERAARSDAPGIRGAWEKQRERLPVDDRLYGNARFAYHAARQLHPRANDWYREAVGAPLNDAQHAWRVRAALRAGAWSDVDAAIAAMPESQAQEPAWRYWKARALVAKGRAAEAKAIYEGLAGEFHFYGLLAAEALGQRIEPVSDPARPSAAELALFGAEPGIRRAVKLAQLEMRAESQREWLYVVRGRNDDGLLLAADYARRAGLYDRAINTADRTKERHDFGLRYMMPFREHFAAARVTRRPTRRCCSASRARSRGLRRISFRPRARSASCN